jgi:hypothetical protein
MIVVARIPLNQMGAFSRKGPFRVGKGKQRVTASTKHEDASDLLLVATLRFLDLVRLKPSEALLEETESSMSLGQPPTHVPLQICGRVELNEDARANHRGN